MMIDIGLALLTGGVGWIIWTAFLSKYGQTPAKRLRDKVVIHSRTGRIANGWRFFGREMVIVAMFGYVLAGFIWGFGLILDIGGFWINTFVIPIFLGLVILIDALWLALPAKRRLVDVIFGTNVVEGEGISYQSFAPQGQPDGGKP